MDYQTIAVVAVLSLIGAVAAYLGREWLGRNWRLILSRATLPMLAVPAAYGVYSFAHIFLPTWVAIAEAAAFEATYIGLAAQDFGNAAQRQRAKRIAQGAVGVSILYNSLAAYGHLLIDWYVGLPWYGVAILSIVHGAPLALVAYYVADLTLHSTALEAEQERVEGATPAVAHAARRVEGGTVQPLRVEGPAAVHGSPKTVHIEAVEGVEGERVEGGTLKSGAAAMPIDEARKARDLSITERLRVIHERLQQQGDDLVWSDLADELQVSYSTIRRDRATLIETGAIHVDDGRYIANGWKPEALETSS